MISLGLLMVDGIIFDIVLACLCALAFLCHHEKHECQPHLDSDVHDVV